MAAAKRMKRRKHQNHRGGSDLHGSGRAASGAPRWRYRATRVNNQAKSAQRQHEGAVMVNLGVSGSSASLVRHQERKGEHGGKT